MLNIKLLYILSCLGILFQLGQKPTVSPKDDVAVSENFITKTSLPNSDLDSTCEDDEKSSVYRLKDGSYFLDGAKLSNEDFNQLIALYEKNDLSNQYFLTKHQNNKEIASYGNANLRKVAIKKVADSDLKKIHIFCYKTRREGRCTERSFIIFGVSSIQEDVDAILKKYR